MALAPHAQAQAAAAPHRTHHAAPSGSPIKGTHPQRTYVANHLRGVANQVENSAVAHAPMTPTEKAQLRHGLKHAREAVAPPAA